MKKALFFIGLLLMFSCQNTQDSGKPIPVATKKNHLSMFESLYQYANSLTFEFEKIPAERRKLLKELAQYIRRQHDSGKTARLNFICTHNSRRSHMGQIWAAAAARFYEIKQIETYSGGTEATAFNPRAIACLRRAGFTIDDPGGQNPRYRVYLSENDSGMLSFSKRYNDAMNPSKDFAAVMTCTQADAECPFIPGADFRLALSYDDPKEADDTPEESARYDERCRQIGREIMYAFSLL